MEGVIVVWNERRSRYEAITSYLERNIPKGERWRWDAPARRWFAPSEDIARRLARYATGAAALRLTDISEKDRQALADSTAADAQIQVPAPPGLEYLPYQRAGIAYALGRRNTLIGDEMGLGKTIQAIGFVNCLADASRVLILCPASLRLNWRAEWRRWHTGPIRPVLLDGPIRFRPERQAFICSYDSVRKYHPQIAATEWDVLICDEAHLLKDAGTRRAKTVFGGKHDGAEFKAIPAARRLFLTGTPIVNRAAELWPLVHALAPDGLGKTKADFIERYGSNGRLDELHMRLRTQIMVRRRKDDVLKQLPKKRRQIVLIDVAGAAELIARERGAISLQQQAIKRTRAEIVGLPHQEQVMRLRQCRAIALSEIARVRHETALAKLPAAIEQIRDALANVEKIVVFCHHLDVHSALAAEFGRIAVGLTGETSQNDRHQAVERFQRDKGVRVFLGSIRAAGLGLTLTAASVVVFVELDWTPAAMMQAEDRLHRIGQINPVLAQHLVIDGSIDQKMSRILIEKQAVMDAALDGGAADIAQRDILREVLEA